MEDVARLWVFLPLGYLTTVMIEVPVLAIGLSHHHPMRRRVVAGIWLTACTYPIVVLVMPIAFGIDLSSQRYWLYIIVAESFAPAAECALFAYVFHTRDAWRDRDRRKGLWRDFGAIFVANILSYGAGLVWYLAVSGT